MEQEILTHLLNSRGPISGEWLAETFQVSRNAVWKAVQKLKAQGYQISAVQNRGYQLVARENPLHVSEIRSHLPSELQSLPIVVRGTVTSTNSLLKAEGEKGDQGEMVLAAQAQTEGRGRLGRSFFSPEKTGLYLSFLLRPKGTAAEGTFLTTAAAAAVAEAIEAVTGRETRIKWVNDLYMEGKKVCGILTEGALNYETNGLYYAVLGIGINVFVPQGGFSTELTEIAGALYTREREATAPEGVRNRLAAEIIRRFYGYYQAPDPKSHMRAYRSRSFLTGLRVTVRQGNARIQGVVTGIDEAAALMVERTDRPGVTERFCAGEVTLEKDFLRSLAQTAGKEPMLGQDEDATR